MNLECTAVVLAKFQRPHNDVTVLCSDVRVVAVWRAVSTHTADVSRSSDVEWCVRGRAGRAIASTRSAVGLASVLLTDCRQTAAGHHRTGCTTVALDDHSSTPRGMTRS